MLQGKLAKTVAEAIVRELYEDLVDPGGMAGEKFTPESFPIARHLKALLPINLPARASRRAIKLGVEAGVVLWAELNKPKT